MYRTLAAITLIAFSGAAFSADFLVEQKDKKFSPNKLSIKVGDTVEFRNMDPFNHNVFSLSDGKTFDLGSYPKGNSKKVTFDKAGTIEVECAIHPEMRLNIDVK